MDSIWVVVDHIGRQFIGKVTNEAGDILTISEPILVLEVVQPPKVDLRFQPVFHVFDVPVIEIRWVSRFPASEQLISAYDKYATQIKAARSGIQVASSIPNDLKLSVVKS